MKRKRKLTALLIATALLIIFAGGVARVHGQPTIPSGDNPAAGDKILLNGQWDFYWNQLLTPEEIRQTSVRPAPVEAPSSWRGMLLDGEHLPRFGYATYRKVIEVSPQDIGKNKALYLRYVGSAYRIWIDGKEMQGMGTVGRSADQEKPKLGGNLIYFVPRQASVEIVLQISNYSFRESGIFGDAYIGGAETVNHFLLKDILKDISLIGGFIIIGLYHLIVFGMRKNESTILCIGLFAIVGAARTLSMNEDLVYFLMPRVHWPTVIRSEYVVEQIAFLFLILLMRQFYPKEVNKAAFWLACGCVAGLIGYMLVSPTRLFTSTMPIHAAILACILIYFVFYVGIKAAVRKREGARINLIAVFIIMVGICNDALNYTGTLHSFVMIEYCILVFLLLQAVIVSYRYSMLKGTLELKVIERTRELTDKNHQLAGLQNTRTKMLANIAHDLGSPIVGIQTYLQLMKEGMIRSGDGDEVAQMAEKSEDIKKLVDELFELSKLEAKEFAFHYEEVCLKEFVEGIFHRFEPELRREAFRFEIGVLRTELEGREASARIDRFQIQRVLRNYIANAVKFSHADKIILLNGFIQKSASGDGGGCEFRIEIADRGVGIAPEDLPLVFQRFYKKREANPGGSGLGLAISKEIIEQHGGSVGAESKPGEGSLFYFTLPVSR